MFLFFPDMPNLESTEEKKDEDTNID